MPGPARWLLKRPKTRGASHSVFITSLIGVSLLNLRMATWKGSEGSVGFGFTWCVTNSNTQGQPMGALPSHGTL